MPFKSAGCHTDYDCLLGSLSFFSQAFGQNVLGCVPIADVGGAAMRTGPFSIFEFQFLGTLGAHYEAARMTGLRRVARIDQDNGPPVKLGLVFQHRQECPPANIAD